MKHILFTLKGCPAYILDDEEKVTEALSEASKKCGSTLLGMTSHKFSPQGVTAVALLAESHISMHTWPEKGMAICDVFTCGDHTNPQKGVDSLYITMRATDIVSNEFTRPLK
jgi:S-adenosylmethionine decarboxylase